MVNPKLRYEADLRLLEKALATLKAALREPKTDISRDAVIQRFEYVFELAWKTMQAACVVKGQSPRSPRDAIRRAFELGWMRDPDPWFRAQDARNLTSHTYNETLAEEVFAAARVFPEIVDAFLAAILRDPF